MARGKVKWFNDKKGFGFIVDPLIDGDIFAHFSVIEGDGFRTLAEGEEVEYDLASDAKGARASRIIRLAPPVERPLKVDGNRKQGKRPFQKKERDALPDST